MKYKTIPVITRMNINFIDKGQELLHGHVNRPTHLPSKVKVSHNYHFACFGCLPYYTLGSFFPHAVLAPKRKVNNAGDLWR